jgi:SAM-dependent methyltransferase
MSGFSAEWLALREPSDHRARNPAVLAALKASFADRGTVTVVDLGCGTGSNLRATTQSLPRRQRWQLVDHDATLLAVARNRLIAWADSAERSGDDLKLSKDDFDLTVSFMQADLGAGAAIALGGRPDLVTAAALFDLVSRPWIEEFARRVASGNVTFYTALTYNGIDTWHPSHRDDADIIAAFLSHQRRDKGFGPSAGPDAIEALEKAFLACDYQVVTGDSSWKLDEADRILMHELADGVAQAVRETGQVPEERITAWLRARTNGASCTIGHTDLLATPR